MTDPSVAAVMAEITQAYERARVKVEGLDPRVAFTMATELRDELSGLESRARRLRAAMAERIYVTEGLTLAELGESISLTKARADQLVREAQGRSVPRPKPKGFTYREKREG